MNDFDFDVVVAGGGAAGLCCAASLADAGLRVALVTEYESFEWSLRDDLPDGRGYLDDLFHHSGWAGGAWFPLARRLKLPVRFSTLPTYEATMRTPSGEIEQVQITEFASADALADSFFEGFKRFDYDLGDARDDYMKAFDALLSIDVSEYDAYGSIGFMDWMTDLDVNFVVSITLHAYCANLLSLPHDLAAEHVSVTAALTAIRGKMQGEGVSFSVMPNAREGLFEHFAAFIERSGGSVIRNTDIAQVVVEHDRATGIALRDGREVRAAAVAAATPPRRTREMLTAFPTGVKETLDYQCELEIFESFVSARLDRTVMTARQMHYLSDEMGACIQVVHPIHATAPWAVPAGEQFIVTRNYQAGALTTDAQKRRIKQDAATEEFYPGFLDAVTTSGSWVEGRNSLAAHAWGPKLPRTTEDIPGLLFVGEGSKPAAGLLGSEAGAATGISGAREIAAQFNRGRELP